MLSGCDLIISANSRENSHSEVLLQVVIAKIKLTLLRIDMDYLMNNLAELLVKGFLYSEWVQRLLLHHVRPSS